MTVSVAMAAYNGSQYIKEQLDSIICQLGQEDEIVISLDPSTDNTKDIVLPMSEVDSRIKLVEGKGEGVKKNFENAILNCKNDIIFLCDQDDVWCKNKVQRVLEEFSEKNVTLVMHNAKTVDASLNVIDESFFKTRGTKTGIVSNIIKNSYIGCCMAFKKEMVKTITPFPDNLPMHDQWIGLLCEKHGGVSLIDEPLILYRRHGDNVSSMEHSGVMQMIKWRLNIITNLIVKG